MVAALFVHLSVLHCSSQPDHEFFSHSLNSIRVIAFRIFAIASIFFLIQLCQPYGRLLREWLITFQFPQGKKASGPWLRWTICQLAPRVPGQLNRIFLFGLLVALR